MLKKPPFEELIVWQKAHELVLNTYQYTTRLPKEESSGLIRQLREQTTTIAARIAEGHQSAHPGRRMQMLMHAEESLRVTQYLLRLCEDLSYGSNDVVLELTHEIGQLLKDFVNLTRHNLALDFAG